MRKVKLLIVAGVVVGVIFFLWQTGWQKLPFTGKLIPEAEESSSEKEKEISREKMEDTFNSLKIQLTDPSYPVIDFMLKNLQGEKLSPKDFRGKFLWINFWASWCGPCRAEMPSMQKIWEKFGGKNFALLAINLREKKEPVYSFVKNNGYTFPVLLDKTGEVASSYGVKAIPTSFFAGPEGKIVGVAVGAREWDNEKFYSFLKDVSGTSGKLSKR